MNILNYLKIRNMDIYDYNSYKYKFSLIDITKYDTNVMYREFLYADKKEEELKFLGYYYPAAVCSIRTIEAFLRTVISLKTTIQEDENENIEKKHFSELLSTFTKYWGAKNEKLTDNLKLINTIRNDILYHPKASKIKKESFEILLKNKSTKEFIKLMKQKDFEFRDGFYKKKYTELEKLKNEIIFSTIHYIKSTIEDGFNPKATAVRYK